jgi:signal transduction histidine kinase
MTSRQGIARPPASASERLRSVQPAPLGRALSLIGVTALLLGVTQLGIATTLAPLPWSVVLFTIIFWIWMGAGLIAWWRRPTNGTGAILVLGGIALYLSGFANVSVPVLDSIAQVFGTTILSVAVHLLHAFPSGRLRGVLSIITVSLGYVVSIGFDAARTLVSAPSGSPLAIMQSALGGLVMVVTAIVLVRRVIAADPKHRRVLAPLFLYGTLAVLAIPLVPIITRQLGLDELTREAAQGAAQIVMLAGFPIAFLIGVLAGGFSRTSPLEALSAWLASGGANRPAVARALASTLGDDSLRVVYWVPERGGYVDESGTHTQRSDEPDRGWIEVRVDDRTVGAIEYDVRMVGEPEPVRRAGEVLAIAIDRERLIAELLAANEELQQSRVRLVEAADRERTRIARDLHDGLQVQLVLLALEAQTIANSAEATPTTSAASEALRRGIDTAAADLRRFVHDVVPSTLLEQGLTAAAEDLVDRLEMPATLTADVDEDALSPAATHTAYFVLAEALANAVKHARASTVNVELQQSGGRLVMEVRDDGVGGARLDGGTGLRGLSDRVEALAGTIEVQSRRGWGTRVRVELPCRS